MDNRIENLRNILLKDIFNAVTEDEVLKYHELQRKFYIGNNWLPPAATNDIISGAASMKGMLVWQCLITDLKHLANKTMYERSIDFDGMVFGKAMLYSIDLMEKKLQTLSQMSLEVTEEKKNEPSYERKKG